MKNDWWKGLGGDPEALAERKELVRNSSTILKALVSIMESKKREYEASPRPQLDDAAWALRMADANGYLRCLKETIELLTPDKEEV